MQFPFGDEHVTALLAKRAARSPNLSEINVRLYVFIAIQKDASMRNICKRSSITDND